MKKYFFLLALSVSALFSACDGDDVKPVAPTKPAITTPTDTVPKITYVTAKTWRLTAFMQGAPGSTAHTDIFKTAVPNCQKDDIYRFAATNVLTISPGNSKCSTSDADQTGTWDLNNNSTLMTITNPAQTIPGLTGEFTVVEITASRIIITRVFNSSQYTLTFSAL